MIYAVRNSYVKMVRSSLNFSIVVLSIEAVSEPLYFYSTVHNLKLWSEIMGEDSFHIFTYKYDETSFSNKNIEFEKFY